MTAVTIDIAMSSEKSVTLTYWNGRGRAELIRLVLAFCDVDYEEAVPGLPGVTHLSEPEHLEHLKESGYLLSGSVPLLCYRGLRLVQSSAIVRFVGATTGRCGGNTPTEVAKCDMVAETVSDWLSSLGFAFEYGTNGFEPSDEERARLMEGNAKWLPRFERILRESGTGLLVGTVLTYADALALEPLERIASYDDLAQFPLLRAFHATLRAEPRLAAWLASDRRKCKTQDCVAPYKASVEHVLRR